MQKECKFCGKLFTPRSNRQVYCDGPHYQVCPVCGKQKLITNNELLKYPPSACSYACRVKRTQATSLQRYGCKAPGNNPRACSKRATTMLERYGVRYAMQNPEIKKKAQLNSRSTSKFLKLAQVSDNAVYSDRCEQLVEMLPNDQIEHGFKIADVLYELKSTDTNTLIDFDATAYRHDKYYHRDKSQLAEENGYRCIHVFDWDDLEKIMQLLTKPTRRVFARKCTIYRLNKNVGDEFLQQHHIQGTCRGQLLYLGLVYEGELLQVMTFGKSRFDKNYDVELLRLCTKPGVVVVGGASKLFSYATNEYGLSKIISYCDRAKFNGDVYTRIGMQLKRITPPQEIWSKGTNRITANLLRARGYDQLFGANYGKGTSNEALMLQDGWLPIFDCGQKVFVYG